MQHQPITTEFLSLALRALVFTKIINLDTNINSQETVQLKFHISFSVQSANFSFKNMPAAALL